MKILILILMIMSWATNSHGLTIVRNFVGGTPPTNSIGNGNLIDIFNTACDVWEMAFPNTDHVLKLNYEWSSVNNTRHALTCQEGVPNRETAGVIYFDNRSVWYLASAPLKFNEVSNTYSSDAFDLGVGLVNVSRVYSWSTTNSHLDLFTAALHEIGHALGMSIDNATFQSSISNNSLLITCGSYVGMSIPMDTNNAGVTSHILPMVGRSMMNGFAPGERVLPSVMDIVALGELSKFQNPNVDLAPVLKIGKPFKSSGKTKVTLSWLQLLPVPTGKQYKVQSCTDLNVGNWTTLNNTISNTDGRRSSTVIVTGNVFFRLKLM